MVGIYIKLISKMKNIKYLIIGGGIAGTTAAETIRKSDMEGTIAIVSDEPHRFYSRVMISKPPYFTGKIPEDRIFLKTVEWYEENHIEFIGGKTATALNTESKTITLDDGSEIIYEKLLLAIGAHARELSMDGSQKKGIFYMRTLKHCKEVKSWLPNAKKGVTIGGGIVSFEVAELLKMSGLDVTMLIREPHFLAHVLDETSSSIVEKSIEKEGIKLVKEVDIVKVLGDEKIEGFGLNNGEIINCDIAVCGIGVIFSQKWLTEAGIDLKRGILTNEYLETSKPDVWSAGDVTEYKDIILEQTEQFGSWSNAREQGKAAALNMLGEHKPFEYVSFYNANVLGVNMSFVGDIRNGENRTIIERGSKEENWHCRMIILDKELIGATLINKPADLGVLTTLIKDNVDISDKHEQLKDPDFDLKGLL